MLVVIIFIGIKKSRCRRTKMNVYVYTHARPPPQHTHAYTTTHRHTHVNRRLRKKEELVIQFNNSKVAKRTGLILCKYVIGCRLSDNRAVLTASATQHDLTPFGPKS